MFPLNDPLNLFLGTFSRYKLLELNFFRLTCLTYE